MFWRSFIAGALALVATVQGSVFAKDHTFVGPTLNGITAAPLTKYGAYSFLAEIGPRNFRANGTVGYEFLDDNYIKFSAEWLTQKLRFTPVQGGKREWVRQESYGVAYTYNLDYGILNTIDLGAELSRSHDKRFKTFTVTTGPDATGATATVTTARRIIGVKSYGANAGFSLMPFEGTTLSLAANYDHTDYRDNSETNPLRKKEGFGGTVKLRHQVYDEVVLDLAACWRRPYDDYRAAINCYLEGFSYCDRASLGVFGSYTHGKYGVENVANAGIQLAYWFGNCESYCLEACAELDPCYNPSYAFDIVDWVSTPATYRPVVLTRAETIVTQTSNPVVVQPGLTQDIPDNAPGTNLSAESTDSVDSSGAPQTLTGSNDQVDSAKEKGEEILDQAGEQADQAAETTKDIANNVSEQVADTADHVSDQAKDEATNVSETAKDTAKDVSERASDLAESAKNKAADAIETVKDTAKDAAETAKDTAKDVAVKAGDTFEKAKDKTKEAAEKVKGKAKETVGKVKEAAKNAGEKVTTIESSCDEAKDSAKQTGEKVADAVEEVRNEAKDAADEAVNK